MALIDFIIPNLIFCCTGSPENYFGLVGQQNYNSNPKFYGRYIKNKNIDHGVKYTYAVTSTQATYEIDHVSLLQDSTISSALNFCFYVFYCNLSEQSFPSLPVTYSSPVILLFFIR